MLDIREVLQDWIKENDCYLITDTTQGLNVDRDRNISDRGDYRDKDAVFLNIAESGTLQLDELGRSINIEHTYELGLFKKCLKETDGDEYYNDNQFLMGKIVSLFRYLSQKLDVSYGSYSNAVDQLDSNNVCIKLQITISEKDTNLC